jgi:hypothetical protein
MNNPILRKLTVNSQFQPLSSTRLVGSFVITSPTYNSGLITFKADSGPDVPWEPGEWHEFHRVNLADLQVKGAAGDVITIIGGTW